MNASTLRDMCKSPFLGGVPIPQLQSGAMSPLDDFSRATDHLNKLTYG